MELEVRFTVKGKSIEYPFTVIDLGEGDLFLYSNYGNEEFKYKLNNKEGNLSLSDQNKYRGSRNLVGIIVSYSHPKFRPLPHGNKSIGGVGSHRASL